MTSTANIAVSSDNVIICDLLSPSIDGSQFPEYFPTIILVATFPPEDPPIPNAVFNASKEVTPVPPLVTGSVPVTPGRGEAANVLAAEVEPRFTNIDGLEVIPVPPLATGRVPEVILAAAWL